MFGDGGPRALTKRDLGFLQRALPAPAPHLGTGIGGESVSLDSRGIWGGRRDVSSRALGFADLSLNKQESLFVFDQATRRSKGLVTPLSWSDRVMRLFAPGPGCSLVGGNQLFVDRSQLFTSSAHRIPRRE